MSSVRFNLSWPKGLTAWDMNRLVRAKRTCTVPDELARLSGKGVQLTPEAAYGLIDRIMYLWEELGFYPLDASVCPEEWTGDGELPVCVLATTEARYIDYNDMPRILALHDGTNLPTDLSEDERRVRIRRQRGRPVLTTQCRHKDCDALITITVKMAAQAIRAHQLVEKGDIYEPSTLCKKHRAERDELLAQKREHSSLRVSAKQAARWGKRKEMTNVDSNVAATTVDVVTQLIDALDLPKE